MSWFMKSDQTAALESSQVALGMAVVSDQSVAIGITAVSTPFTDLESDLWYFHQIQTLSFIFVSGVGFHLVGGLFNQFESKAMRKVEDGQDAIVVLENSSLAQGSSNLTAGRFLLKLH